MHHRRLENEPEGKQHPSTYLPQTIQRSSSVHSALPTRTIYVLYVPGKPAHHVREFAYPSAMQGRIGVFNRDLLTSDKQNKHS